MTAVPSAPADGARWKRVRVFISSTFRDMHAERDHLVKVTFPRLRQWCEQRRLHLVDIDLRWGITREEAENGKAVEICLEEIDGSRPFFICLLGAQYGSLAPPCAAALAKVEPDEPYSITHLEIVHAALQAHALGHDVEAFFYLRDPASLPPPEQLDADPAQREAYAATFFQPAPAAGAPDLRLRLAELKDQTREAFGPADRVRAYHAHWDPSLRDVATPSIPGRLAGLGAFGEQVESDLKRAIEAHHAAHLAQVLQPLSPLAAEQDRQDAFIASRVELHVPDAGLQERVDAYVAADSNVACCVWGGAGSGKSAALCWWASRRVRPGTREWAGEVGSLVVFRAAGASPASTRVPELLASVWGEVVAGLGAAGAALPAAPRDPADLVRQWPAFLAAAATAAPGRLVLVVDALDQLDATASLATWIPVRLPPKLRLVVSTAVEDEHDGGGWRGALRLRGAEELRVPPLDDARSRAIIAGLPSLYAKTLDERQVDALLANPASRNPLFLTVALRELKLFGAFDRLDEAIANLPRPAPGDELGAALHRLFDTLLARVEADEAAATRPVVGAALGALAGSRRGLAEADLLGVVAHALPGLDGAAREAAVQVVLRQLRPYLQRRYVEDGALIGFFHRSLAEQVAARYLPDAAARAGQRRVLAAFFDAQPWRDAAGRPHAGKVAELAWLRLRVAADDPASESRATLAGLLLGWPLLQAKHLAGLVYELAGELAAGRAMLEGRDAGLVGLVEEALRRDIGFIDAHREDYPQALLQCLWNSCWWYDHPCAAAHYADGGAGLRFDGELAAWADACRAAAAREQPDAVWLRQLRPGFSRLGAGATMRITGFGNAVVDVAWSPDGRFLVAASTDPAVRVIDAETGQECLRLEHVGRKVLAIAVSPDSQRFALGLQRSVTLETLKEFSLLTGELIATHKAHRSAIHKVRYGADGQRLYAASDDGTVSVWSVPGGELLRRIGEVRGDRTGSFLDVGFDVVGRTRLLAWCSNDKFVKVCDADTGAAAGRWAAKGYSVNAIEVSPDGEHVAFYAGYYPGNKQGGGLWVHKLADGKVVLHLERDKGSGGPIAWSPDGRLLAKANESSQEVRVWRVPEGECVLDVRTHLSKVEAVVFSPDGRRLATASGEAPFIPGSQYASQFEVHVLRLDASAPHAKLRDHTNVISALHYSPDGSRLVTMANRPTGEYRNETEAVRLWDADGMLPHGSRHVEESIARVVRVPGQQLLMTLGFCDLSNEKVATAVRVWHADGMRTAAVRRFEGWVGVRATPDGHAFWLRLRNAVQTLGCHEFRLPGAVRERDVPGDALAFSADGVVAALTGTGWGGSARVLRLFDARSLAPVGEVPPGEKNAEQVCFSPRGDRLVYTEGYAIVVLERPSLRELHRLRGHPNGSIHFLGVSDDGEWLTSASDDVVRVWRLESGECVRALQGSSDLSTWPRAPFAGSRVPVAAQGVMDILDTATGSVVASVPGNWRHLAEHPSGGSWAAATDTHFAAWRLERMDAPLEVAAEPRAPEWHGVEPQPPVPPGPLTPLWVRFKRLLWRWVY
jgi:WD40 repeat protein